MDDSDCQFGVVTVRDASSPRAPDLRLTLRLPANPVYERLAMDVNEDEARGIAAWLDDLSFAYQTDICPLDR